MSPLDFIRQNADLFARCGSVVATYRVRAGRRFGPYYRLIYRQDQRQRSFYLGRCEQRAAQVRDLLAQLQQPRNRRLTRRRADKLRKAQLLQAKRQFQHVARTYGLTVRGWVTGGFRALRWPRIDRRPPAPKWPFPKQNSTTLQDGKL